MYMYTYMNTCTGTVNGNYVQLLGVIIYVYLPQKGMHTFKNKKTNLDY